MDLPPQLKAGWIVFLSAITIMFFGGIVIFLAIGRMRESGRFDQGLVLGILCVVWGAWALWSYKPTPNGER
jgi:hypothetical protein